MKCVESLIKEANEKGLWLNNLFQLRTHPHTEYIPPKLTGQWQANFHSAGGWYEFGHGDSAVAAIEAALAKAGDVKPFKVKTPPAPKVCPNEHDGEGCCADVPDYLAEPPDPFS